MSTTLTERIAKTKAHVAKLEEQQRLKERREREAKRKKDQQRHYIVGELVAKYFPDVLRFEPGIKGKNAIEFAPLEAFLEVLAEDHALVLRLKGEAARRLSLKISNEEHKATDVSSRTQANEDGNSENALA